MLTDMVDRWDQMTDMQQRTFEIFKDLSSIKNMEITSKLFSEILGITPSAARSRLRSLRNLGLLCKVEIGDSQQKKWVLTKQGLAIDLSE